MITFDNITVAFGDFTALPDFDLTIEEGEFFTLLGPSGCGKTTALRTLAGFVQPAAGKIRVAGKDVTRLTPDKREIGMVFQNYALFPSMTVRENIAFGLAVKHRPKAEVAERVAAIAADVRLTEEQLGKSVAALSGGQQQRVAIARALVTKPKILLLDEPLSNLDAKLRHQLRGQLKDLQSQFGITTVYVTHDQEEALTMSDRIAVINQGRIEQVGPPEDIYDRSASEFVCTFIGDVNRLDPAVVDTLRTSGAAGAAQLKDAAYVRVEKPHVAAAGEAVAGVPFSARVVSRSFHGLYTSYRTMIGDTEVKVIGDARSTRMFEPGDEVTVGIDPTDVLSYGASS
ncbi:ABC transporter ATP-binding protein [Microbacterium gorillae]|uniref:ABC transporter ATP-binding protein n=1 Tax=Microbacterium gorillae TaxID=1231063 RepID=UPI00058F207F|nr:ABC transporter ATP-binding protein [Microbacterium gorillae]